MGVESPVISFLSDYGLADEFVGVCHGVIARRCPAARVIDVTHAIPPHDVRTGALVLRDCVGFLPAGVHLAIVDPGVGATGAQARRAVALRTAKKDRLLVGPDNGLLLPAAQALGGVVEAVDIGRSPERLEPVSRTFHGRDVFAPVAAALAAGAELSSVGERLSPSLLVQMKLPAAEVSEGALLAHVLRIDRFGNAMLDASWEQLRELGLGAGDRVSIESGGGRRGASGGEGFAGREGVAGGEAGSGRDAGSGGDAGAPLAVCGRTFAEVDRGELLLYEDSRAMLALAVNEGSAAAALGLCHDDLVVVRPA